MTSEIDDPTLQRLRRMIVLEPDPVRSRQVQMRCRAAITKPPRQGGRVIVPSRLKALALERGLTYGLCVGYLFALIHDVVRVYMRR